MRNIKRFLGLVTMVALLLTSCSKEEEGIIVNDSEKATLSFGTLLNDLMTDKAALKQAANEIPECSDEAPAYVEVVLSGPTNVGTMMDPIVVAVNPTPGDYDGDGEEEYFTEESVDLELEPGDYSLDFFAVYDGDPAVAGTNRIWIAPMAGGSMAGFVSNTLPMDISLGAGVKKYVDVEVLCFDDRLVNEYGYLFFDLETTEAFEFCFFANFCDDNGRHYTAAYSVNIWLGEDNTGSILYSGVENVPGMNNDGDFYASPVCFALPNLSQFDDDEDYIYYEVTLLDWEDNYGDITPIVISDRLSRNDIEGNFNGDDVDYEHLRFGCGENDGETPVDSDGDGVEDSEDDCPNTEEGVEVDENGCPVTGENDSDGDGVVDSEDDCPGTPEGVEVDENGCAVNGENDSDGDGVVDSEDDCPGTPEGVEVDENGCAIDDDEECITENQNILTFDRTVDISNFPVGQDPFFDLEIEGEAVGVITFNLDTEGEDDKLIVSIDMFAEFTITAWELSLPGIGGEICLDNVSENDFDITYDSDNIENVVYPLSVELRANYVVE